MLKLMMITNEVEKAQVADSLDIDRIFIDLERLGKLERQGHLDTHISDHDIHDVKKIKKVLTETDLLVRVNPINIKSKNEIDLVIKYGADIVMLPMFTTAEEVKKFIEYVGGRAKVSLLLETSQAFVRLDEILELEGIDEIHIGLNDLHLSLGLDFMFELMSTDIVENIANKVKNKNIILGIGGIARLGEGLLPAEVIIKEHYRLGSEVAILSRTFDKRNYEDTIDAEELNKAINDVRKLENEIIENKYDLKQNRILLKESVKNILELKKG